MQAYAEGFEIMHASDYSSTSRRSPSSGTTARSSDRGCSSWPSARSSRTARTSTHLKGWVADSGEGRWTVQEAIDHDVPAPVITLSLLTRFRSRQDDSLRRQGPRRPPQRVRRPRSEDRVARRWPRSPTRGRATPRSHRPRTAARRRTAPKPAAPRRRPRQDAPADDPRAAAGPRRASAGVARQASSNPLREGLRLERVPDPHVIGPVRGDRRPLPSQGLPGARTSCGGRTSCPRFMLVAVGRRPYDDETFREDIAASLETHSRVAARAGRRGASSSSRIVYHRGDFADDASLRRAGRAARRASTPSTARAATGCSTWPPSRRPSRRSSPSSAASASTTSTTAAAGAGSSSRSRSAATSTRRCG